MFSYGAGTNVKKASDEVQTAHEIDTCTRHEFRETDS